MKLLHYSAISLLSCVGLYGCFGSSGSSSSSGIVDTSGSISIAYVVHTEDIPGSGNNGGIIGAHDHLIKTDGTAAGTQSIYSSTTAPDDDFTFIGSLAKSGSFIYFEERLEDGGASYLPLISNTYNQLDTASSNTVVDQTDISNSELFGSAISITVGNSIFAYRAKTVNSHAEAVLVEYDSLGVATNHTAVLSSFQILPTLTPIPPMVIGTDIYFAADAVTSGFIKFDTTAGTATHIAISGESTFAFSASGTTLYAYTASSNLYSYNTLTTTLNTTPLQSGVVMQTRNSSIPESNGYLLSSDQTNLIAFNTSTAVSTTLGSCINSQFLYTDSTDTYLACANTSDSKVIKVDLSTTTPTATTYSNANILFPYQHAWAGGELYFSGQSASYINEGLWFINSTSNLAEKVIFSNTTDDIRSVKHLTELNGELVFSARNDTLGVRHFYNFNPSNNVLTELY